MTDNSRPPIRTVSEMIGEAKEIIRENSRPPDWAVARAFWEAGKYHEQSPWWAIRYYIQDRAREIAEGAGDD